MRRDKTRQTRTLDQPRDLMGMVKPGEVIDIDRTGLSLTESRIFNKLIAHAMDSEDIKGPHIISKRDLLFSGHQSTDELAVALTNLQRTIVKVATRQPEDGKPISLEVQMLGGIERELSRDRDASLVYHLDPVLIKIISMSDHWARLQWNVMASLKSKYALALYEMISKRINLRHKMLETFELGKLRRHLGVPENRLQTVGNFVKHALSPSVDRVNSLADFSVAFDLKKTGRMATHVNMTWWMKASEGVSGVIPGDTGGF